MVCLLALLGRLLLLLGILLGLLSGPGFLTLSLTRLSSLWPSAECAICMESFLRLTQLWTTVCSLRFLLAPLLSLRCRSLLQCLKRLLSETFLFLCLPLSPLPAWWLNENVDTLLPGSLLLSALTIAPTLLALTSDTLQTLLYRPRNLMAVFRRQWAQWQTTLGTCGVFTRVASLLPANGIGLDLPLTETIHLAPVLPPCPLTLIGQVLHIEETGYGQDGPPVSPPSYSPNPSLLRLPNRVRERATTRMFPVCLFRLNIQR